MSPSPVLFVARLLLLLLCARCVVSYNLFWVYFDQSCTQPWAFGATDAVIQTLYSAPLECYYVAWPAGANGRISGSTWVNWQLQQSDTSGHFHFEAWRDAGCSAVSTNYKILEFDATTASNNFTCVKGTNYTQGDSATHSAWFTLVTDTVPGAGAGGGGGVPVGPQTQEGWSMETKMMVVWAVLAVVVAVAVGGYCFYQRSRRSAAQQQQGGAAPLLFPGSGQSVGGDPQQYAAMP